MAWAVFLTQPLLASVGSQIVSTEISPGGLGLEQEEDEQNSLGLQKKSNLSVGDEEAWYCVPVLDGACRQAAPEPVAVVGTFPPSPAPPDPQYPSVEKYQGRSRCFLLFPLKFPGVW